MIIAVVDPYSFSDPTWPNSIDAPVLTFLVQDEPESDAGRFHVALFFDVTNYDTQQIAEKMQTGWFMMTWDGDEETVWFNDASFLGPDYTAAAEHAAERHGITDSYLDFPKFFQTYKERASRIGNP